MKLVKLFRLIVLFAVAINFQNNAQNPGDKYKNDALGMMSAGKYGEAIDLLNKYIGVYPSRADGYNLRGKCYERRNQLVHAQNDFRIAAKLAPGNREYQNDLNRVNQKLNNDLNSKIKGYQREIAINPKNPKNYLEIAKCYKLMFNWVQSEAWYDKYLELEEPSADEVIRYTEVLSYLRKYAKGEPILQRFVRKYPNDWRLWSRYGYFEYYLGKSEEAKMAFETALKLRPYFKEAQDGLDMVLGKYFPTLYKDTTGFYEWNRPQQKQQQQQQPVPQEFAIDKYYRILRNNPKDDKTRFLLIDELIKYKRYEEAYQQLLILEEKYKENEKWVKLYDLVTKIRQESYTKRIEEIKKLLEKNPNDTKLITEMVQLMSNLDMNEEAYNYLNEYFEKNPNSTDCKLRTLFAKIATDYQDNYKAIEQLDFCLNLNPDDLDLKLQRGIISVWLGQDEDLAYEYLSAVLAKRPKDVTALIGMASLEMKKNDFEKSEEYINLIKQIEPTHPELETLLSNLETSKARAVEEALFQSLEEGREKFREGDCEGALAVYDDFLSKHEGNRTIMKEYADLNSCVKNYDRAIEIYDSLLNEEYDYLIDLERAKVFFFKGDYQKSISEFERLVKEDNADFAAKLFLGDAYAQTGDYDKARDMYDSLLVNTTDSTEIALINQRMGWLPVTGLAGFLGNFPQYILLNPFISYFEDNADFSYLNYGLASDLGVTSFLSIGLMGSLSTLRGKSTPVEFNTWKATAFIRPFEPMLIAASIGEQSFLSPQKSYPLYEAYVRFTKEKEYLAQVTYLQQDAATILYSALLVYPFGVFKDRLRAEMIKAEGWYNLPSKYKVSGSYQYIMVGDGNRGANTEIRIGKYFYPELLAGYEFYSTMYARRSIYYYSPRNFISHSLFADWNFYKDDQFDLSGGGRIGYIPESSFWLREFYLQGAYTILQNLRLNVRGQMTNTSRDGAGYSSRSVMASLFWML
ncbi:MAG: tetratricopeptide repeat protein [Ignavibacteriales bacterium]|nr:MAG: tetratricopeptide repeat protein [Ignavibacteriaceae bacterium]MBW7871951.1 tetratricopeptide repeat protein [Ignavibacteria bacterium]MBZ0197434.1 tetratricopeptide repeat protein [Ignavibacteriaceae bacterium]MCZ2144391.1 tetratricopeptide repeat protein [Ignavibacteriales bacterium]WKZ72955.1 MAG: tetratricopeptide repeat protein [Ignavibacteriaceae bacterium]